MKKIILDLCGGTGAWSRPYKEAGYTVYNITLPDFDLREARVEQPLQEDKIFFGNNTFVNVKDVYGIFCAPPCTMFSLARTRAKLPRDFEEGMELVEKCLEIVWAVRKRTKLTFWALENPMGYLRQFLGKPPFAFEPWEFGDRYTKKTDLWGYFNFPSKKYKDMREVMNQTEIDLCKSNSRKLPSISDITGSKQADRRAITPPGFAKAFYKANP